MFTSIPFWRLETYDSGHQHPAMMEHCRTFSDFVGQLRISLEGTVEALRDGAWVLVHCGPMRHQGQRCDIPFEVKKILDAIDGVTLQDEIVLQPPPKTGLMRAGTLYSGSGCKLINNNTRIVVAWKGDAKDIPRGDQGCVPFVRAAAQPGGQEFGSDDEDEPETKGRRRARWGRVPSPLTDEDDETRSGKLHGSRCWNLGLGFSTIPAAITLRTGEGSSAGDGLPGRRSRVASAVVPAEKYRVEWLLDVRSAGRSGAGHATCDSEVAVARREFLVRWAGYGAEDATWEPEESLLQDGCRQLVADFDARLLERGRLPDEKLLQQAPSPTPPPRLPRTGDRIAYRLNPGCGSTGFEWIRGTIIRGGTAKWPQWAQTLLDPDGDEVQLNFSEDNYHHNTTPDQGCW